VTPFEKKFPNSTKDTRFVVVVDGTGLFSIGSVVSLYHDDGTSIPLFKLVSGHCDYSLIDGSSGAYLPIGCLETESPRGYIMRILNLTQHNATSDQREAGVVEPPSSEMKKEIQALLTFDEVPNLRDILRRANLLAEFAEYVGYSAAMIGGAPFLMRALEDALRERGVTPMYSFTRRETVEESMEDGSVKKTAVFRHAGWVTGGVLSLRDVASIDTFGG
jgi:hypothetical protein